MSAVHRTAEYARFIRRVRPIIRATLPAPCVRCGRIVEGQFDVGHRLDAVLHPELATDPDNVGPEHVACNRSAGGTLGRRRQTARDRRRRGTPSW